MTPKPQILAFVRLSFPWENGEVTLAPYRHRVVRAYDKEDDAPLLVVEREDTDAMGVPFWRPAADNHEHERVVEALVLRLPGVEIPVPAATGNDLAAALRATADWCERHNVTREDVYSVTHDRAHRVWEEGPVVSMDVLPGVWERVARAPTEGGHCRAELDGVELTATFPVRSPVPAIAIAVGGDDAPF